MRSLRLVIHIIIDFIGVHEIASLSWFFCFSKEQKNRNHFLSYFSHERKVTKVLDLKFFERKTNEACPLARP